MSVSPMTQPAHAGEVNSVIWRDGEKTSTVLPLGHIAAQIEDPTSLVWIDLVDPDPATLVLLAEELSLEPTSVEDAIAPFERAKATHHGDHAFFVAYATTLTPDVLPQASAEDPDGDGLLLHRVSAFISPYGLITIRRGNGFDMGPVLERWHTAGDMLHLGPFALVHGLLDIIVDGYFSTIQDLDEHIDHLEDQLFDVDGPGPDFQREAYAMRKKLVALRRVVLPMRDLVNILWRNRRLELVQLDPWYSDLTDHVLRAGEWSESLRDMISTIFDTHLALQDARLNVVMKKLSGWAAVLAAITFVTGWFGQNVPFPGFGNTFGYVLTCLLTLGSGVGMWWIMRRHDWI